MDSRVRGNDERMSARWDAIVVGAGIVGAACARSLGRDGMRVLVLDAGRAGEGTTSAGMGHLVTLDGSDALLALTSYALELWRSEASMLPSAVEYDPCGTIWVAETADHLDVLREKQRTYSEYAVASDLLSARALAELEPNLRSDLVGGLLVDGDGVLDPPSATRWMLDQAIARGAELREGIRVDSIDGDGVHCGAETITANVIVNATGVHAPVLTPGLRIVPRKGHLAITDSYPGTIRHQLVELGYQKSAHDMDVASAAFNVQPRPGGQVIIGASRELAGFDAAPNERLLREMLDRAAYFLPRLRELRIARTWTGFRPAADDGLPVIGRWEPVKSLWVAAGHEGLGITTSLATGDLLADLILGRPPRIDPTPYAPARMFPQSAVSHELESRHAES
ncbi:FAD-dependent oxidoreductase [soil metagenome]